MNLVKLISAIIALWLAIISIWLVNYLAMVSAAMLALYWFHK